MSQEIEQLIDKALAAYKQELRQFYLIHKSTGITTGDVNLQHRWQITRKHPDNGKVYKQTKGKKTTTMNVR